MFVRSRFNLQAGLAAVFALTAAPALAQGSSASPQASEAAEAARLDALAKSLSPLHGDIVLSQPNATLHLGQRYYYLRPDDAKKVLTEVWGNPPDAANGVLGMVFPAGQTPADPAGWGAVITYIDDGYVSDKQAKQMNYDKLLEELRKGEADDNAERQKQKFPPIHLAGWAQQPSYDAAHHSLVWAKDLAFGGQKIDTLNYDVRELGRKGVLSLNMVSDMGHLAQVRPAAAELARVADFNPGARYADYKEGSDKKAAYGVAGLIAAGAGVALAQKAGLLTLLILFLKKGFVVIIAALAGGWAKFKSMFRKKPAGGVDL
ncbi:DUF2167 domain-containing protein [Phenylobacterium montanum]|uniref:DUF2167 domain-containing protein n=1 Tax=Phenylobacterium montanum TaxID=2823693 RepID=A0A975FZM4_9CAUL|nr:DUF2167 domain-containing protein [Caulobacter sp. S6]QUD87879.1 DUF2167 domain-containing protein [Caulobacter sp. S6]